MENKIYCYDCDEDVEYLKNFQTKPYQFRGKDYTVIVEEKTCPKCGNVLLDDEVDNVLLQVYNQYLNDYDLSFDTIKDIRNQLNLSQEEFARLLNWSKKTINRYENKQSIPQGEYLNTYVRLKNNPMEIIDCLKLTKNNFEENEYLKIMKKLPFYPFLKSINVMIYFLSDSKLYLTQLMKKLFATDFLFYKNFNITVTNFKYANCPFGPVVDGHNNLIDFLAKEAYIKFDFESGTDKPLITTDLIFNLEMFTTDEINVMNKVKYLLKGKSSTDLSKWSHNFEGWKKTNPGDIIDFKYAKDFKF